MDNLITAHSNKLAGAGFGIRFAARLIDVIIQAGTWVVMLFVVAIALGIYTAVTKNPAEMLINEITTPGLTQFLFAFVGAILYHVFSEGLHGTSPGKRILGLVVIKANGTPCSFPAALRRTLAFYVDGLFFGLVAYASMSPPLRQRVGDRWANTIVIRRSSLPAERTDSTFRFSQALATAVVADSACYLAYVFVRLA